MCFLCEVEGKKLEKEEDCKRRSYREALQDPVIQTIMGIQKFNFGEQIRIIVKTATALAYHVKKSEPEKMEEFYRAVVGSIREGVIQLEKICNETDRIPKETCVICEKRFHSDGSGEVPVCPKCLMSAGGRVSGQA